MVGFRHWLANVSSNAPNAAPSAQSNTSRSGALPDSLNNQRDKIAVLMTRVRASEAEHLSEFSSACFDQTYGPMCRAADVDAHIAEHLSASAWLKALTAPTSWVFAAIIDDEWAAYTHVQLASVPEGTTATTPKTPSVTPLEICRLYVARKWHGQGVAATVLSSVRAHARLQGAESVWLSSWQENARANAFYAKWDFARVGTATFLMGEDLQHDYVLQHVLTQ